MPTTVITKTFRTNAGALATRKRILAGKTEERFRAAAQVQALRMKQEAQALSGGTLSRADQRRMGYPYALRLAAGAAGIPDFIINQQSGRFASSWQCRAQKTARGWTVSLWNTAPESAFLLGTDRMRPRPILDEVQRRLYPELARLAASVCAAAVRENAGSIPAGGAAGGSYAGGILYAVGVGLSSAAGAVEGVF